jgi:hypothetical protein
MSGAALGLVLLHVATAGAGRASDEGAEAHVFQLLIAGQAPFVAYFALRWMPRMPAQTLFVLGFQAAAALLALAPVVFFDL